jgi:outer membrane lipoprotein carrier protein
MKKILTTFILFLISTLCFADDSAKRLLEILTPVQNMQAQFEQSIVDKKGHVLEKSAGKMSLLRPGKFRWDTEKPAHQLLIADGNKIWLFDESLKQVTVQSQAKKTASPVMLLSDPTTKLTEQFHICCLKKTGKQETFTLSPKNKAEMFQKIQLIFEEKQLAQMQLFDSLGQKTIIKFSHVHVNETVNPALFQFVIPSGVDVVSGS